MQAETRRFFELLFAMTEKELRARYKYTVFGFFWLVVNPLIQMLVIGFVFRMFMKEPIENYYYYLFIGLLVWNFFALSLNKATPSIVFERDLIKKSQFPRSVIPLSIILSNFIHLMMALVLFFIPVIFLGTVSLMSILYFFPALVLIVLFTAGLSLLTSALNVRFRDINFFVQALLIVWFYATPIMYSINMIPRRLIWIWRLNPVTVIVQLFQHAFVNTPLPGPAMTAANLTVILLVIILGVFIFRSESKNFDDWL